MAAFVRGVRDDSSHETMNEPAKSRHVGQPHPLLADRERLDKIVANMDLTIQKIIYRCRLTTGEERLLHGGTSVRDVLQEALMALLQFDPASLSGTWEGLSVTIAKRRAIDAVRGSVRGRRAADAADEDPDEINIVPLDPSLEEHILSAADVDEPEHAFVVNEQQRVLLRLARDLPDPQRAIFNAVHFEGRTRVDVGVEVGLTPQRVGQIYTTILKTVLEQARRDPKFPSDGAWEEDA